MSKVRLAIVGVGNCASSLVQGLEYYKDAAPQDTVPGLMHVDLGGYHIHDVELVAAFDVDAKKVDEDVAEAIFTEPNNTIRFSDVPPTGVSVQRGPTLDGLGKYYREVIEESDRPEVDVAQALRDVEADVVVCYLPVGSEQAAKHYAQAAIDAGVAFVNCLPVFIASDQTWARKFVEAGLPIVGDDIKSQVGATITHRVLTKRFEHAALVQGCGGMQQGEEDKIFQVERLAANLCNPHLPFQQCLRRPIPQRADQFRVDHRDLLHQKRFARLDFIRFRVAVVRGPAFDHVCDVDVAA